jgi:HEAT repeats/Tetratricopeptide repeat
MTLGKRMGKPTAFWFAVALVAMPTLLKAAPSPQSSDESDRLSLTREAEQDAQDRAQEKADRDQEKRDREQDRANRTQELYDSGRDALDEGRYQQAEETFSQLAQMNGPQTDAAFYWKAYAQNMQGKKDNALASLADLKQRFPQSRWIKDAGALEIQVRQSTGKPLQPEAQSDVDLKILALQGVMNSDPARGMTIAEKLLNGAGTPKDKAKILFVLAQSGSPQAMDALAGIAKGQNNPDMQRKAVEYLGIFGGAKSRALLAEIYASSSDDSVKRAVLRSYMISGDKQDLFNAAKNEKNDGLKREAIRELGISGGQAELQQLYQSEPSTDIRREILQGFFLAGDSQKLVQAAQNEKDPELRKTAIRNLGLIGGDASSRALQEIYAKETDPSLRKEVLNAYFLQGNAKALVAIAKTEKDPDLKKTAVEKLSLMGSKEATDYLMELLNK